MRAAHGAGVRRRIASIGAFYPYLAAREGGRNGAIVGYAYASRAQERAAYRWNAELSVYLEQGRGGRGAGTALYRALLGLLALQNIRNVYGTVTLPNAASLRLHEKFGFRPVGVFPHAGYKLGRWHDVLHLEKALGDPGGTSGSRYRRHTRAEARRRGGRS